MHRKKNNDVNPTRLIFFIIVSILISICFIILSKISGKNIPEIFIRSILEITKDETKYVSTEIDKQINLIKTIEPHIDENTNTKYITYEDIGIADNKKDSYIIMRKTHEIANENNYEVRATLKEYHIYKLNELMPIYIKTNTNWNNAKIIIHDENISKNSTKNYSIFEIAPYEETSTIIDENILKTIKLNKETTKIEQLKGHGTCLCKVYNANKKQYIRSGIDQDDGNIQVDLFKIDNDGKILNDVLWDFESITKIEMIPIPTEKLIVQNGDFQTNLDYKQYEPNSEYWRRNIRCYRSNTILKNINHSLDNDDRLGGAYFGFFTILNSSEIDIINCKLTAHKYKKASNYDFTAEYVTDMRLDGITSDGIEKTGKWGITGTNYTKDITYRNCILNRIDAHRGVHNLIIDNCIVGVKGLTLNGSGDLNIFNTKRIGGNSFIELRSDYGSSWNGSINITNCQYNNINKTNSLILFRVIYDSENVLHNYGYPLYLPNVKIDGLTINEKNTSSDTFYIFDNNENATKITNGDIRNIFNLPTNVSIKNYEATSGRKIKLFSNEYYNNIDELGINLNMSV